MSDSGGTGKSAFREYAEAIGIALLLALGLRFFVIEAFKIPSGSMIDTLEIGDFIFINKFAYRTELPYSLFGRKLPGGGHTLHTWGEPARGDVMVFRFPPNPDQDYIKRVIGVAGDTIEMKRNELLVNGEQLDRSFVRSIGYQDRSCTDHRARVYTEELDGRTFQILMDDGLDPHETFGPVTVKPGHVFVMGDNRDNSSDSRAWGQVPIDNIKGEALFVWLSVDSCGGWMDRIRWSRFGHRVQ